MSRSAPLRTWSSCIGAALSVVACCGALCTVAIAGNWPARLATSSHGQAGAGAGPTTPTGVTSACASTVGSTVTLTWTAVPHATSYTIYDSTTSATGTYAVLATGATGTSWTSGSLSLGTYWFEMKANIGTNWTSGASTATAERVIAVLACV
jgi:hypothetical protein